MAKALKIAMLGHKRVPSRDGGVEVVVEELATRMVKEGHRVTCYNRSGRSLGSGQERDKPRKTYRGVALKTVFTVDRKGIAALTASFFGAIRAAFGEYDVVHFHAEGPCLMMWLPKLFGKRCIATIHGLDWQRARWGKAARRAIRLGEWVAVHCADEIIVLSEGARAYFWNTYRRETVFIPNGVNRPAPCGSEVIRKSLGLAPQTYILFLGRLVPEKGIAYLLRAFRSVRTPKRLVIAGDSPKDGTFIRQMKALAEGDDRVIFTGFVQGQMLEELYGNAYLYALPSDVEGMPLSLLEAMSHGNCCLVSDIAACTEVVENRAWVFPRADVEGLRAQLQYACDHPEEVKRLRRGVADWVCGKYDWDDVVNRTLRVYRGESGARRVRAGKPREQRTTG